MQFFGLAFCLLLVVVEIYSLPAYAPEDYEQGVREMMEELERQGLTGPIVPRAFPNHHMMRKSQRSNSLRLRFGKRSGDNSVVWKTVDDNNGQD
ncbi:unnamed protein product [Allacma fusca]|uniref:Short neuropeptide F n=1 Tax=Allacma fusca TaxID=39272 RepID=A0A8J2LS57_9HEXA|nr:unnamed protein product [Allacma fusca]